MWRVLFSISYASVLFLNFAAAESSAGEPSQFTLIFQNVDLEELSAEATVRSGCSPLDKNCSEAMRIVRDKKAKSDAVTSSMGRLNQQATEFTSENTRKFSNETDLLQQLADLKTKSPIVVFEHTGSPIYFLKFNSPELQEASLARIGIFAEDGGKIAPGLYPSLPADGHDYRVSDLGRFFTEAEKTKTILNPIEERLLQSLLKAGLLQRYRDEVTKKYTYITGKNAAVVSVAGTDKPTLTHELNHAVYFSDSKFRTQVVRLYQNGLTSDEKKLVDKIMGGFTGKYDFKNDPELFLTEFSAYFRDPDELWTSYLKARGYPEDVKISLKVIANKLKRQESNISFYRPSQSVPASRAASAVR